MIHTLIHVLLNHKVDHTVQYRVKECIKDITYRCGYIKEALIVWDSCPVSSEKNAL